MSIESTTAIITQHLWLWHLDSPARPTSISRTVTNGTQFFKLYQQDVVASIN